VAIGLTAYMQTPGCLLHVTLHQRAVCCAPTAVGYRIRRPDYCVLEFLSVIIVLLQYSVMSCAGRLQSKQQFRPDRVPQTGLGPTRNN
jgi:hypothetical protein